MKNLDYEIAILGGGCVGAAILHELTRLGHRNVVLVDNGRRTLSATANSGGMLRVFHEGLDHTDLALGTHRALAAAEAAGVLKEKPRANGSLYFFDRTRFAGYQPGLKRMDAAGYPFEIVTPAQGRARFPEFRWNDQDWAVWEPEASHRSPASFVDHLLIEAEKNGAAVLDSFEVQRIFRQTDRYRLCGGETAVTARWLILAGGARMLPRLRDLGLTLSLETKVLSTGIARKKDPAVTLPNFFDRETLDFGRFGAGNDVAISDPRTARVVQKIWRGPVLRQSAADSYAPNRAGLLGQVPGHRNLLIATGWGGTAFKFSLEIGRRVARLVDSDLYERSCFYA